jgi:hypothetical protein
VDQTSLLLARVKDCPEFCATVHVQLQQSHSLGMSNFSEFFVNLGFDHTISDGAGRTMGQFACAGGELPGDSGVGQSWF